MVERCTIVSLSTNHQPSSVPLTMNHSTLSPSSSLHSPTHPTSPIHSNFPTQTYHSSLLPRSIPTPSLLDSVAGGAHYSGVESVNQRRRSLLRSPSQVTQHTALVGNRRQSQNATPGTASASHLAVMDDVKEVRWSLPFTALSRPRNPRLTMVCCDIYRCTKVMRPRICCRSDGGRTQNMKYVR